MVELQYQLVREEVFTFTGEDGTEIHVRSGALRLFLKEYAAHKIIELTFPADETMESIINRHGVELDRLNSMTAPEAAQPVIVGLCNGGTHILIDGAHRRAYWAKRGIHKLQGWAVPEEIWRSFPLDAPGIIPVQHHKDGKLLPQRMKR